MTPPMTVAPVPPGRDFAHAPAVKLAWAPLRFVPSTDGIFERSSS